MKLLDVVALTEGMPERHLRCGQVGTIVETLDPGVFEVEFADMELRTYASLAVTEDKLMILHHGPVEEAA